MAKFAVGSHLRSHPDFVSVEGEIKVTTILDNDIIATHVLPKYIQASRSHTTTFAVRS